MKTKGFIELHHYATGAEFTIALRAIGFFVAVAPKEGAPFTRLTITIGNSPKEEIPVSESYDTVRGLIAVAE